MLPGSPVTKAPVLLLQSENVVAGRRSMHVLTVCFRSKNGPNNPENTKPITPSPATTTTTKVRPTPGLPDLSLVLLHVDGADHLLGELGGVPGVDQNSTADGPSNEHKRGGMVTDTMVRARGLKQERRRRTRLRERGISHTAKTKRKPQV